jgi:hypothetical protein
MTSDKKTVGYIGYPAYCRSLIEIKDECSYDIAKQILYMIGIGLGFEEEEK